MSDDLNLLIERKEPFRLKSGIKKLEVFSSVLRNGLVAGRDLDLLVTLENSDSTAISDLLEMAGEAEEIVGTRVDLSCFRR